MPPQQQSQQLEHSIEWKNPTKSLVKVRIFAEQGRPARTYPVEPGGTVVIPAEYERAIRTVRNGVVVGGIAPQLQKVREVKPPPIHSALTETASEDVGSSSKDSRVVEAEKRAAAAEKRAAESEARQADADKRLARLEELIAQGASSDDGKSKGASKVDATAPAKAKADATAAPSDDKGKGASKPS